MTEIIKIDSHGTAIQVEIFHPTGASNGGVIVVAHGSDGMNEPWAAMIRDYATDLAAKGLTVLIPHYFETTGTVPGPRVFAEFADNLQFWEKAVSDTIGHGKMLFGIVASRVGLLGFSLGGHLCLRLRESANALVEFFAPELLELGGIGAAHIPALPVQIHHGAADVLVPFANTQSIAAALKLEGAVVEVFSYDGAGHGFAGSDANDATARRFAKGRTLAFFGQHLS